MAEFDLIERIQRRVIARHDVALGIGDDAALLRPPPGMQLAVATDTLNSGVHFPAETAAEAIGWKALAVNLSDLAAMGAAPAWCSLSLSMPADDAAWLDGFLDGFSALAAQHELALIGGDTTRGPLSICVSVIGLVEAAAALRRAAAKPGDDVWVSGSLGDAAAALAIWQAGDMMPDALRQRLDRPTPRIALGRALIGIAHACIDISDGLLADLGHVAAASAVGIEVDTDALPASPALRALAADSEQHRRWQASGGDDYELCFTAPAAQRGRIDALAEELGLPLCRVGRVFAGAGISALAEGRVWQPGRTGYTHFQV